MTLDEAFERACPSGNYMVDGFGRSAEPDPTPEPEKQSYRVFVTVAVTCEAFDREEGQAIVREKIGKGEVDVIDYDWE